MGGQARLVVATREHLSPKIPCILAEHTEEEKYEEALEGVENCKEDLEHQRGLGDGQCSKYPRQSKQEHHAHDANKQTDCFCFTHLFLHSSPAVHGVSEQHHHHNDKYDSIEEQNGEDGAQEGTKEHGNITNEAAGRRRIVTCFLHSETAYVLDTEPCTAI